MQTGSRLRRGFWLMLWVVLALAGLQILLRVSLRQWVYPTRQASWIWLAGSQQSVEPVAFYAVRDFDLGQVPTRARLITVADEESLVFLNGVPIGGTRYGPAESLKSYDVAAALRQGRNRIVVEARSTRGVGGLLVRLSIEAPNGSFSVVTDSTWRLYRQTEEALLEVETPLPEGERPHVWGPVPVGRWQLPDRPAAVPTIAELRTTEKATAAVRFRSGVVPRRWQNLAKTDRSSPALGNWITFDFGTDSTAYLALRFPSRVPAESRPVGILYLTPTPAIENRQHADAYVVAMPGQRVWLAARPRRFRYATYVGLTPVSGADSYEVDSERAEQVWPEEPPPVGPFGLPAARSGPSLEDVVWGELHRLAGLAVGE